MFDKVLNIILSILYWKITAIIETKIKHNNCNKFLCALNSPIKLCLHNLSINYVQIINKINLK